MGEQDLDEVLSLQAENYRPDLHDSRPAFLSRMALAPDLNLVARSHEWLAGYLVSHPWTAGSPPPVDAVLPPEPRPGCWYVHDLSVAVGHRGAGVSGALLARGAAAARARGLTCAELVAVDGAEPFWRRQGWRAATALAPALAAKVAQYGPAAVFMVKPLA